MLRLAAITAALAASALVPGIASAQTPDPFGTLGENGVSSVMTSVPIEQYAPTTMYVSRSMGLHYINLDQAWHDVVALDATRDPVTQPAPWCAQFTEVEAPCPLFWTPLLPPGGSDPQTVVDRKSDTMVQGLKDAEVGKTYTFYCSIHPRMVGTIEVVE